MLMGGDEILAKSRPADQWKRAGIRGKGDRKRKGRAVRKVVCAMNLAGVDKRRKYY